MSTILDNDFHDDSEYFLAQLAKLRTEAYLGAGAAGVVGFVFFGPFSLSVSYAIAAGVVEGELIPALKRGFEETEEFFDRLEITITGAQDTIET